ncbi:hypothetical protein GH741_09720 [Aquibacillus halophilus]|uniref:Prepilin-type N-terminal cleavage/methylation domain-containing protein n=1 Tax=Aquibacillus halophilus TaxID=930132 RepID=A0A6A8DNY6_9BACI|nr:type II secretion system protein [Aquibacillus halophilus]MRH42962.1 hypothetical protein [Aquibacillus halophilus]
MLINNEKGITLVELVATLAIMSMVIVLIGSVHIFGQKQFSSQTEQIKNQSNVRVAINTITKEIRSVGKTEVTVNENVLTVGTGENSINYQLVNSEIRKNGKPIITGIEGFSVKSGSDENTNEINITITSSPDQQGNTSTLTTVIYMRE